MINFENSGGGAGYFCWGGGRSQCTPPLADLFGLGQVVVGVVEDAEQDGGVEGDAQEGAVVGLHDNNLCTLHEVEVEYIA